MKVVMFTLALCATLTVADQLVWHGENTQTFLRLCRNSLHAIRGAGQEIGSSILS